MNDQDFERKEKARQDAMFDAQLADEPTSDVEYADEPLVNGWPLYSGLPQPMKPTQEQVIAWVREAGVIECDCCLPFWPEDDQPNWEIFFKRLATIAYEAGRKDEKDKT